MHSPTVSKEKEKPCCFEDVSLKETITDTPDTRERLARIVGVSENAAAVLKAVLKRATSLRETLRQLERDRTEFSEQLQRLDALYEAGADLGAGHLPGGRFQVLANSLEESNRMTSMEAQHITVLLLEPLQALLDEPNILKKELKTVQRQRSAFESISDKVRSSERKAMKDSQLDMAALGEARTLYRKSTMEYAWLAGSMQRERRALLMKQFMEYWLSQRAQVHSVEKGLGKLEGVCLGTLDRIKEYSEYNRNLELVTIEQRKVLEASEGFQMSVVIGQAGDSDVLQGWLWKRSSGKLGVWSRKFFRVSQGVFHMTGESGGDASVPLVTARVKLCSEADRVNCFLLISPSDEMLLQAATAQELDIWFHTLEKETVRMLNEASVKVCDRGLQRSGGNGQLEELRMADPLNALCADCGAINPEWAAINLGVLFCINCSGIHRQMGVQVSKVRSFQLDAWSEGELAIMFRLGNNRISKLLLEQGTCAVPKPSANATTPERDAYIVAKYARKEMMEKPDGVDFNKALLDCVKRGEKLETVLHMILCGGDVNYVDQVTKESPLHFASGTGDLACLWLLLLHGANVSLQDATGCTALHVAAKRGDIQITSSLFKRDADPAIPNNEGLTPTEVAAKAGQADCVTLLRLASLSLNEKDGVKDSLSFSLVLDDFTKGLLDRRKAAEAALNE